MRRWLKWSLLLVPVGLLLFIGSIHPILAFTELSGGKVAVVEGWMPRPQLEAAAALIREGGYTRVHTTGTIRPFAYYLKPGEALDVVLRVPASGEVVLEAAGLPGALMMLLSGSDTLCTWVLKERIDTYRFLLNMPRTQVRLLSQNPAAPNGEADNVFTLQFSIGGENVHLLQRQTLFVRADGSMSKAWPTFAHVAAYELHASGIPEGRIEAVPSWGEPDSRSWANAAAFGLFAHAQGYTAVDVFTMGVHARRSRNLFRRGCGPEVNVGVVSIPDARCARADWWRHWRGWFYVLKEVAGSSEAYAVDLTH